jgi:peptidoglycan/LPS O-acetylase OafA/YrhL
MIPTYRPDIDGLRAIAVLSVLLFHAGFALFGGGYVGVDVFFVISGYLITTIIVRETSENNFSLARFYERRFRRILPALAAVVIACFFFGLWLLTPKKLVDFGESAFATALFSSNLLFYSETGYFDDPATLKPLLHTWSLAVEEQYYIFFPLLIMLISRRFSRQYLKVLVVLTGLSFITSVLVTRFDSAIAFYSLPTRAWELLIGGILALHVLPKPQNRYMRESISALGLTMIAYSVTQFTSQTVFPGFSAALPTLGAALIIYSGIGGDSCVSRILAFKPVVYIGLMSYSLYLWHWPVLVYTKTYLIQDLSPENMWLMMAAIFVISYLSWQYIETPIRTKKILADRKSLLRASVITSLIFICCGIALKASGGFPQRNSNDVQAGDNAIDHEWKYWQSCENVPDRLKNNQGLCGIGAPDLTPGFILWGDSHARALASGIDTTAKKQGYRGFIATESGCPPLLFVAKGDGQDCLEFNKTVLNFIAASPSIHTVILAARWSLSANGNRYKHEEGKPVILSDHLSSDTGSTSNAMLFDAGLNRTIVRLHQMGKRVVLVNQVPEIGFNVPSSYFVAEQTGRDIQSLIAPTLQEYQLRTESVIATFNKIQKNFPVKIVHVDTQLCAGHYCDVVADGAPLYRDDNHLSTIGSKRLSGLYDGIFNDAP